MVLEVGLEVPKNAILPSGVSDIRSAMAMFDAGYHLNHRKDGRAMFDPATGKMTEGLGHYRCTIEKDRILVDVDVAYDWGSSPRGALREEGRAPAPRSAPLS